MTDQNVPSHILVYERVKSAPLNLVFVVHFVLTTWGIQGYWSPDSYLFYNLLFFLILLWCIHNKESEDPVLLGLVVNVFAILFDVIVLSVYFPRQNYGSSERFSVAMAILNLVVRTLSCMVLYKQWNDRSSGSAGFNFNNSNASRQPKNYQDIEAQPNYPGIDPLAPPYH